MTARTTAFRLSQNALSTSLAYTVVFCIPLLAAASMLSPTIHDLSIAVLLAISGWVIWQDPRQLRRPLLWMALTWMAFVLASAIWARAEALPGDPLRNWHKHIFIAIAPLVALSFAAALHRLQWHTDRLLLLFIAGLSGGSLLLLVYNGAIGTIWEWRPSNGTMGGINRNLSALVCGLTIVSLVGLLGQILSTRTSPRLITWTITALICVVLAGLLTLLGLLHSRAGFVGTSAGLAILATTYAASWTIERSSGWRSALRIIAAMILITRRAGVGRICGHANQRSLSH